MIQRLPQRRTLALNVGNSSILGGVFHRGRVVRTFRVDSAKVRTGAAFRRVVAERVGARIEAAVVSSVVPRLGRVVVRGIREAWGVRAQVLDAAARHGLKVRYARGQLGADRLAAALGAAAAFPGEDVVFVDCGTATTVNAVDRAGVFRGGAILPGAALWPEALATRTAQLPAVGLGRPRSPLGRDTRSAIQAGIHHGHAGAIREVVAGVGKAAFRGRAFRVVATGGNACHFAREKLFTAVVPDLILLGLGAFARRLEDA